MRMSCLYDYLCFNKVWLFVFIHKTTFYIYKYTYISCKKDEIINPLASLCIIGSLPLHMFKIKIIFYLSHTQLHREYITSSEMYSLHLTHPKWTHTRSSGQPCYSARGAVGGLVPCSRTPQSWYWRSILPQQSLPDLRFEPTTFRLQVRLAIH